MQVVGRSPKTRRAPPHVLFAGGYENRMQDVEAQPHLIEQNTGPARLPSARGGKEITSLGGNRPGAASQGGRGSIRRQSRVIERAAQGEGAHAVVWTRVH